MLRDAVLESFCKESTVLAKQCNLIMTGDKRKTLFLVSLASNNATDAATTN
jgi:hypothetical protein